MPELDFSDPQHRIDNLTNMRFVRAWARVRHHVFAGTIQGDPLPWLEGYMNELERQMAQELGISATTLVGRLIDLGQELVDPTDGQDQAATSPA